jgi:hypothetical protein
LRQSAGGPHTQIAIREVLGKGKFRMIPMAQLREEAEQHLLLNLDKVIETTDRRARDVVELLFTGLDDVVYSGGQDHYHPHPC